MTNLKERVALGSIAASGSLTLGKAAVVTFTIGKEETGKIMIQTPVSGTRIFTWEKGTHIGISISTGEKSEVQWKQQDKEFVYD